MRAQRFLQADTLWSSLFQWDVSKQWEQANVGTGRKKRVQTHTSEKEKQALFKGIFGNITTEINPLLFVLNPWLCLGITLLDNINNRQRKCIPTSWIYIDSSNHLVLLKKTANNVHLLILYIQKGKKRKWRFSEAQNVPGHSIWVISDQIKEPDKHFLHVCTYVLLLNCQKLGLKVWYVIY